MEHVPEQRLCDSAWWYLLFRAQLVNTGASSLQGPSGVAQLAQAQDAKEAAKAAAVVANQAAKAAAKAGKAGYKALKNELRAGYNKAMNKDKDKGPNDGLLPPAPNEPDHGIKDGARFLYETLLPVLNCRALLANVTAQTVDWAALPAGGHAVAPSHVATEAARFVMRGTAGLSSSHADQLLLLLRWTILRMADAELRNLNTVAPSDDALLRASCRHLAALATELSPPLPPTILTSILSTFSSISSRLDSLAIATNATKSDRTRAPLTLPTSASAPGGSMFPFVGRLRRDFPIDHLAGESQPSPILIPCELTLIPHLVNSYDEAAHALRRCEQQCTLLNNQMQLLRNSVQLRLALIQHTLIELLPIPLPTANCFWQSHPMRVETQGDLLRTLHRLSRALHAASFSLTNTPSLDAARMTTSAAIACLVDAILRARVEDAPTLFCMHYSGRAGGPTSPFGFSLGAYDDESDSAPILSAALALARPRLLYYMAAMDSQLQVYIAPHIPPPSSSLPSPSLTPPRPSPSPSLHTQPEHTIFNFGFSLRPTAADNRLLSQLPCRRPANGHPLPTYRAVPQLVEACFEQVLRDVCFGMAMMCAPNAEHLPPVNWYYSSSAALRWGLDEHDESLLTVSAFGMTNLKCAAYASDDGKKRGGLLGLFGGGDKHAVPRAPHSRANVETLAGSGVLSEDDVLHVKSLPTFDGRLKAHDSELLLQYLTVPYLRIPLLLRFFADRSRIKSLASPKLQATLSAALFEPGAWRPPLAAMEAPRVTEIPTSDGHALSTPAGLLLNELRSSPESTVDVLSEILELTLEMDVGRYAPPPLLSCCL